jgi:HD-like signal output (HDOD) protein
MSLPRDLVASIDRLDPLPVTIQALVTKLDDEMVSPREVARVVEYDQAMVAVLLRAANSPVLGGRVRVERVSDAVLRMGIDRILTVVLGAHFRRLTVPLRFYDLSEDDFWYHGAVASLAAQDLMVAHPRAGIPTMAPVAALLHDIGKLILVRHAQRGRRRVLRRRRPP